MSIIVVWDEPHKKLLHFVYRPQWTQQEFEDAACKAQSLINTVNHPVYFIIDQQQAQLKPEQLLRQSHRLRPVTRHPNTRLVIVLGAPLKYNALSTASTEQKNPLYNFIFAPTVEDIHEILWGPAYV
jgi:hypothetical protein